MVGDLWRSAWQYTVAGQNCVNVMYFKETTQHGDTSQDVADALMGFLAVPYRSSTAESVSHQKLSISRVSRLLGDGAESSYIAPAGNTGGSSVLAPTLALLVRIRCNPNNKNTRGRIYLAGLSAIEANGRVPISAGSNAANFVASMTSRFIGAAPQSGFQLGVFSPTKWDILSNPFDDYFKPASGLSVDAILATQRRRRPGVGS